MSDNEVPAADVFVDPTPADLAAPPLSEDERDTVHALTDADMGKRFTWQALGSDSPDPFTAVLVGIERNPDGSVQTADFKLDVNGEVLQLGRETLLWYVV